MGRNLWNPEYIKNTSARYEKTSTGIKVISTESGKYCSVGFKFSGFENGKTYTFNTDASITSGQLGLTIVTRYPDGTKYSTLLAQSSSTDRSFKATFTIPFDFPVGGYFEYTFNCTGSTSTLGEVEYSNIMFEEGSTLTEYEPFNNTIYGGYVDLVNGEIVAEWKKEYLNNPSKWYASNNALLYDYEFPRYLDDTNNGGLICNIALAEYGNDFYCRWRSKSSGILAIRWVDGYEGSLSV